jgi:phosphoglycerate dehydrogenase-like enzyme
MPKALIMYSNEAPGETHLSRLQELLGDIEVIVIDNETLAIEHAAEAEIILGHRYFRQTILHTKRLKWLQSTAAGVHHLISPVLFKIKPVLTRCPIFADVVALHAVTLAMSTLRCIPEAITNQHQGRWVRPINLLPLPSTAMILGMGFIGREIASILRRQKITVLGVNRSRSAEIEASCDILLDDHNWHQQLHRVDLLFSTLPLTNSTINLIDEPELQKMPKHTIIVNVGRGGVINMKSLVKFLRKGNLGGAAVDVLDPIPDFASDPLWNTPGLLITPKMAVFYRGRQRDLEKFIEDQVQRYINSEKLLHQVDLNHISQDLIT